MSFEPRANSGITGTTAYTDMNLSGDSGRGVSSVYSSPSFIYAISDDVSEKLITIIQDYFTAYPLGKEYNSSLQEVNKEVVVLDEFSPDTVQMPQIVVSGMPADSIPLHLGNRQGKERYRGREYEIYGGDVNLGATVAVYDGSLQSCKKLADILFLGFMYYIKVRLQSLYIWPEDSRLRFSNPTKVGQAGARTTGVGSEVYSARFNFNLRAEWRQFFEIVTPTMAGVKHTGSVEDSSNEFIVNTE